MVAKKTLKRQSKNKPIEKPTRTVKKKTTLKKIRPNKLMLWFKYFTDESNKATFMNSTGSARAAKYKCSTDESFRAVGYQNFTKLHDEISKWLDEYGMSEERLKIKLLTLIEAKRTIFQKTKGEINPDNLPRNVFILSESQLMEWGGNGEDRKVYDSGETILAINVEDPEIQRKSLDMAFKVKGMYPKDGIFGDLGSGDKEIKITVKSNA